MPRIGETEEQRQIRKLQEREDKRYRRRQQEQSDSGNSVKLVCMMCVFHSFCKLFVLSGNSWNHARFTGGGTSLIRISTSMFYIDVDIDCEGKVWPESMMCEVAAPMTGTHWLHKGKSLACGISSSACSVMQRIWWSTFIIFGSFFLAFICDILGAIFLYYYWYDKPLPEARQWAMSFLVGGPLFMATGLVAWSLFTPNLNELPQGWAPGGYKFFKAVTESCPFGWCWWFSIASVIVQVTGLMIIPCFFSHHEAEEAAEEAEIAKREGILDEIAQEHMAKARMLDNQAHGPASTASTMPPASGAPSYGYGSSASSSFAGASQGAYYGSQGMPSSAGQSFATQPDVMMQQGMQPNMMMQQGMQPGIMQPGMQPGYQQQSYATGQAAW